MTISTAPTQISTKAPAVAAPARRNRFWAGLIYVWAASYFLIPLAATFYWSLRGQKGVLGFEAYRKLFADTNFLPAFSQSIVNAIAAIAISLLLIVPTAYWVTLRLPKLRPVVEFITLLPFVIPAVVLVFGLIRLYSRPPLLLTATYDSSRVLLVCVYAALSFPLYVPLCGQWAASNGCPLADRGSAESGSWLAYHPLPGDFPQPASGFALGRTPDLCHRHR